MTEERLQQRRVWVLICVIATLFVVLGGRLWFLQIVRGHALAQMADGNRIREVPINAPRGIIHDRKGRAFVSNRFAYTVSVVPIELGEARSRVVATLARVLEMSEEEINTVIDSVPERSYLTLRLKRDVDPKTVVYIEEHRMDLPGVIIEPEPVRYYHYGDVAGHLLGYLGPVSPEDLKSGNGYLPTDLIGQTGLERVYEKYLRGKDGRRQVEVDARGRHIRNLGVQDPVSGRDIHLTIDLDVQRAADIALKQQLAAIRKSGAPGARGGAVIALDPRNGHVLALASQPGFDPNLLLGSTRSQYYTSLLRDANSPLVNRALQAYPPASTFKPITGIAAIESGALKYDEVYNATGYGPYGKLDWSITSVPRVAPAGRVTIVGALMRSSDDFFWDIALRPGMGIDEIAKWARRFGAGSRTGINLYPPEQKGLMPDRAWKAEAMRNYPPSERQWYRSETADVAIGQGFVLMTPLQVALLYAGIATRGEVYKPILLKDIDGVEVLPVADVTPQRLYKVEAADTTWQAIHEGLVETVHNPRGTAAAAFAGSKVRVAGKTGTAETTRGQSHGWFAGYAPADNPEIVVVVFMEHGTGGSYSAAPVARKVFDAYFAANR